MDHEDYIVECSVPGRPVRDWRYRTYGEAAKQRDGVLRTFRISGEAVTVTLRPAGGEVQRIVLKAEPKTTVTSTPKRGTGPVTAAGTAPSGWSPARQGCALAVLVAAGMLMWAGASERDEPANPHTDREACGESYEGVGDGTVDWSGMCDVPGYVHEDSAP